MGNPITIGACRCGGSMDIHMHKLVYRKTVTITQVPVLTCRECGMYEPMPLIKSDLSEWLLSLREEGGKEKEEAQCLSFAERNEWAFLIAGLSGESFTDLKQLELALRDQMEERIDMLLDLYRFAREARDAEWAADVFRRLSQLSSSAAGKA